MSCMASSARERDAISAGPEVLIVSQRDLEPTPPRDIIATLTDGYPFLPCTIADSAYPYSPIHTQGRIRLLRLNPFLLASFRVEDICGSLLEFELAEAPTYQCLSYVWGPPDRDRHIWLDQHRFPVSENLRHALRCLQEADNFQLVWVDFICINQEDDIEKAAQVQIMRDIYQRAEKVVAYLGKESDGSDGLPAFLNLILMAQLNRRLQGRFDDPSTPLTPEELPPHDDDRWEAFRKFLQRPWFRRVWIIQEAVCARRLYMMCGGWTINSATFFHVVQMGYMYNFPLHVNDVHNSDYRWPWDNPTGLSMRQILLMRELGVLADESLGIHFNTAQFRNTTTAMVLFGQDFVDDLRMHREWRPSLLDILERSRHAQSSNPRDRIYAFANLARERGSKELQPDYGASISSIYLDTAKFFINNGQGPQLICNAGISRSTLGLPSWVPDWSLDGVPFETIAPHATARSNSGGPAAGGSYADGDLVVDSPQALRVKAFVLGRISRLGRIHNYSQDPDPETTVDRYDIVRSRFANEKGTAGSTAELDVPELLMFFGLGPQDVMVLDGDNHAMMADFPPLVAYIGELQAMMMATSTYARNLTEVLWKTVTCDRKLVCKEKAPDIYGAYLQSYLENTRFEYFPSMKEKILTQLARITRLGQLTGFEPLPELLERDPQAARDLMRRVLREDSMNWAESDLPLRVISRIETIRNRAGLFRRAAVRFSVVLRASLLDSGLIGAVPHGAEEGDLVAVLKGVPVPMVLKNAPARDSYRLVGQAYFYGYMDGEALGSDDIEEQNALLV